MLILRPPADHQIRIQGDVRVDPNAMIGPGVLIQADPDAQITIAAGVCIGMGVILHAFGGSLIIEAGVNLGAGVLVVGQGLIAAQCCIGSTATLCNPQLQPGQLVSAGTVIQSEVAAAPAPAAPPIPPIPPAPPVTPPPPVEVPPTPTPVTPTEPMPPPPPPPVNPTAIPQPPPGHVIGEVFLSQLRMTLYPQNSNQA